MAPDPLLSCDPLYFVVQLVLFPIVAVLFGIVLHSLHNEIESEGWVLSPQCVRQVCLCMSSASLLITLLDPTSVLGIIPTPWRLFMECTFTILLLNSACSTFYMFVIVLSKRYLAKAKVPPLFTRLWLATNSLFTFVVVIVGLIGAIIDDSFFFGVCLLVLMAHELFIVVLLNVTLHKVGTLLAEYETDSSKLKAQLRKLLIGRVASTILGVGAVATELINPDSLIYALANTEADPTRGFDPLTFNLTAATPFVFATAAHVTLMYTVQRTHSRTPKTQTVVTL